MKLLAAFLIFASMVFATVTAYAHPQDMGRLDATTSSDGVAIELELDPTALSAIMGVDPAYLMAGDLKDRSHAIFAATFGGTKLLAPEGACTWAGHGADWSGTRVRVSARARCPGAASLTRWELGLGFLERGPKGLEILARVSQGSASTEHVVTSADDRVGLWPESHRSWGQFMLMGIQHIGATPDQWYQDGRFRLPDGIDHILFVIALVLAGQGLLDIIKTVTGFTIGHSVTLALATVGVIHVPSRIVESAIALSIAIVAAEGLLLKRARNRWKIAMAFGLVHGLGFASALSELHLSRSAILGALLGFNAGVEVGQAVVVAAVFPVFLLLHHHAITRRFAVPACSITVFVAGSIWFVQRAFGLA